MSTEIITVDPKEFGLQQSEVATIEQAFLPKIQEREALAELKAKQDAENAAKLEAERIAAEQKAAAAKAAKAPDKEKLTAWVQSVAIAPTPQLGNEAQVIATDILSKLEAMKKWALSEINKL